MDRMRESLFASITPIRECSFLDLFSGSGVVGLEALSRGATPVLLVERDRRKRAVILRNLAGLEQQVTLRTEPVERFVSRNRTAFDIIYLDPPFDYPYKLDLLQRLGRSQSVAAETRVIIHAPAEEPFPERISGMQRIVVRAYGRSVLTWFVVR
jgi:16S rRNA (guanine(966)-N(2))-methyltransferase RsmD